MSCAPKDGGPAFPRVAHNSAPDQQHDFHHAEDGMSLRDWFAGQALAGMMSNDIAKDFYSAQIVAHAYKVADGMLAERKKLLPI